jgi:pSer/pThr/pTyr-binding forkhead associated (FHA) protein
MGPVQVELNVDNELRPGRFTVISRLHEGTGGAGAGALVLPSGERITLADKPVLIGRLPECEITLSDPNVSRRHAEVRPFGTGFLVVDLGSTNGTKVNGMTVSERQLQDGDSITVGATRLRFDAS